jgi:DNA-directed RNA polymerase specialized sigma24 family protein
MRQRSNSEWLTALREAGSRIQEAALPELRRELLGVIKSYLVKEGSLHADETRHLAEDCAQEAILIIQAKLDSFRGESRFTTWAFPSPSESCLGSCAVAGGNRRPSKGLDWTRSYQIGPSKGREQSAAFSSDRLGPY